MVAPYTQDMATTTNAAPTLNDDGSITIMLPNDGSTVTTRALRGDHWDWLDDETQTAILAHGWVITNMGAAHLDDVAADE